MDKFTVSITLLFLSIIILLLIIIVEFHDLAKSLPLGYKHETKIPDR